MDRGSHMNDKGTEIMHMASIQERNDKRSINVVHCNLVNPEDGSILVLQRSKDEPVNPGLWEKLSGKIEEDMVGEADAISANVVKELKEELGLKIDASEVYVSPRESTLLNVDHPKYTQIMVHPTYVVHEPRRKKHMIALRENGHCDYAFVNMANYPQLNYVSGVKESLEKYFKRRKEQGVMFPHELAQGIRCVIIDKEKGCVLMREREPDSYSFPATSVRSGVTPYTSVQYLLYVMGVDDEFKVAPLTAIYFPSEPELFHYFLITGVSLKKIATGQYKWFDAGDGYDRLCRQLQVHKRMRPSVRRVLRKLLSPSFSLTMLKFEQEAVVKKPLRKRSNSMF